MSRLSSGRVLNERFTLVRRLGRGGMGEVWLVQDRELDEQVVAKILPPDATEERIALLRQECRQARRLVHPNIARTFDFHRGPEFAFLTMAYLDGTDIGNLRERPPREILRVVLPVADALEYAHRQGVVHRDVKVSNVLYDADGQPHLLDFGISGLLEPEGLTVAGGGSRYSMSPEQLDGTPPAVSDDIYAFGVLLYELVSGHPPFWPRISGERIRSEVAPAPRSEHPLPRALLGLIDRLLAKAPDRRPADMAVVGRALREILAELEREAGDALPKEEASVRLTPPPRIGPIRAAPHLSPATRAARDPSRSARRWGTMAAIALPALAAAAILLLLPRWSEMLSQRPPAATARTEPVPAPASPPAAESLRATAPEQQQVSPEQTLRKQGAQRALERVMELHENLRDQGVEAWGGEDYAQALSHVTGGDEALGAGRFAEAEELYAQAVVLLEALGGAALEVLRGALEQGQRALLAGDASAASRAFELALSIAPQNPTALTGLRRAEVLDEVMALLDSGEQHEQASEFPQAERPYRRAVELDPLSQQAQQALARVQSRISDDLFSGFMSRGLAALDAGDFAEARRAFGQAQQLRPGSRQVAEALAQVDAAEKLDAAARHRAAAVTFEAGEQWNAAAAEYGAVLALDGSIVFAQDGKARCLRRAAIAERIEFHLSHPERLSADEVLGEASRLLDEASRIRPSGPRHQEQLRQLEQLVRMASAPVRVRLESDDETEVTVYTVGRLGTFRERELELRPGAYTVVGSRRGYRDVRHQLVVVAGQEPEPLVVRCEEKI